LYYDPVDDISRSLLGGLKEGPKDYHRIEYSGVEIIGFPPCTTLSFWELAAFVPLVFHHLKNSSRGYADNVARGSQQGESRQFLGNTTSQIQAEKRKWRENRES
jgi:hypothetical protein